MPRTVHSRPPRVLAFIREYVWGEHAGNGTECAVRAGYSSKTGRDNAGDYACQLLRRPAVKALVEKATAEREALAKHRFVRVLDEAFYMAGSDITDLQDEGGRFLTGKALKALPVHVRRAIAKVKVETRYEGRGEDAESYTVTEITLHPKQPAIDFIAKVSGKLKDVVKHEGLTHEEMVLAADQAARTLAEQKKAAAK